jgi:hypothetical protein
MFKKKSVIVVGAGASCEVGLPVGADLKHTIAQLLDFRYDNMGRMSGGGGDPKILEALQIASRGGQSRKYDFHQLLRAAKLIHSAVPLAISIDNLIHTHKQDKDVELCGKLAIVRSILEAERNSKLYVEPNQYKRAMDFKSVEGTWYGAFAKLLTEYCPIESLEERLSSVAFVVFNYDRCIEHFLYHCLRTYYGISDEKAALYVSKTQIYHPYGTVGTLPWFGRQHSVAFGEDCCEETLCNIAGEIKTFTEGTDPSSSDIRLIQEKIAEADTVLFLGFAFHPLNLSFIKPPEGYHSSSTVCYFATAKGMSQSDCEAITSDLSMYGAVKPQCISIRHDLSCFDLFKEYWRTLSLFISMQEIVG